MLSVHGISLRGSDVGRPAPEGAPVVEVFSPDEPERRPRTRAVAIGDEVAEEGGWRGRPTPRAQWENLTAGPWQARAGLAFAAQLFAQEREALSPGAHMEDFPPALRAYARATAAAPTVARPSLASGLPIWA